MIYVSEADDLEGGSIAYFHSNSDDNTARKLVHIINDNDSAIGATCLFIDQDANYRGLTIDSEATSVPNLYFAAPAMTTGQIIEINDANSLTTGGIAYFFSNSPDNTSSRNLVSIVNENADADKAVGLYIQQDGADAHIEFAGAGGGGIKFSASAMDSTDANTLDDYEEGTFDVNFVCGSGTITANGSSNQCRYTKIGRMVHINGLIYVSALDAPSGILKMAGLPFPVPTGTEYNTFGAASICIFDLTGTVNAVQAYFEQNQSHIVIFEFDGNDAATMADHISTSTGIVIQATYQVD